MTNFRNRLIDRMVRVYGLEHPVVIVFAKWCEEWEENWWNDKILAALVASKENDPVAKGE